MIMIEEFIDGQDPEKEKTEPETEQEKESTKEDGKDSKSARTYTEEEVNNIIKSRISRERKRAARLQAEGSPERQLEEREKNILKRELKADAKDSLIEAGLPTGIADLLRYDSEDSFEDSYAKVTAFFQKEIEKAAADAERGHSKGKTPKAVGGVSPDASLRRAFDLNK